MTRAKCRHCDKRRQVIFLDFCRSCLRDDLSARVAQANAPGASNQVKDECWAYLDRVYKAVGFRGAYPYQDPLRNPTPDRKEAGA